MEAGQLEMGGTAKNLMGAYLAVANPSISVAQAEHYGSPMVAPQLASSAKKRASTVDSQFLVEKNTPPSVSNCYFFKSRLQEYAQKAGIRTPVYETIKEGPSHEPSFRSTVIVNDVRYDSLPGFSNRKAAEQSAAEVALIELANLVDMKFGISQPVHDTGLCKNLLQEYAQKMNYAIPLYECHLDNQSGRKPMYSCVLEIGGIKYIGASASTKKEAEIKVARTALLAIKSTTSAFEDQVGCYTVLPHKKKVTDLGISTQETAAALKPKKGRFKKKQWKKKRATKKCNFVNGKMPAGLEANLNCQTMVESGITDAVNSQHDAGADNSEVNLGRQEVPQVSVADAVGSLVETPVGSQIEMPVTHMGMPAVTEIEIPAVSQMENSAVSQIETHDAGADNSEVNMGRQEVPQVSVADAVGSRVETSVSSQIETPVTHMGMPAVTEIEIPAVSQVENSAVSQIETPVGSGGSGVVANADSFHEPDSRLALVETISDFTHPETCSKNLEEPVISLDEGHRNEGESAAMDVVPDIGIC